MFIAFCANKSQAVMPSLTFISGTVAFYYPKVFLSIGDYKNDL